MLKNLKGSKSRACAAGGRNIYKYEVNVIQINLQSNLLLNTIDDKNRLKVEDNEYISSCTRHLLLISYNLKGDHVRNSNRHINYCKKHKLITNNMKSVTSSVSQ